MRTLIYLLALVLSLPNLLAGLALAVLEHTFVTRNPLLLILNFFEGVFWAVPASAAILLVLLMAGCFRETRAYAAIVACALNLSALYFVLTKVRPPQDLWEAALFVPVVLALIALTWLTWREFSATRATPNSQ